MRVWKYLIILFCFASLINKSYAQKTDFVISAGYYDALSIGFQHKIQKNISAGLSLGTNFRLYNNQEYYDFCVFSIWDLKNKKDTTILTNWFLQASVYNVFIEDAFYKWYFLTIVPSIGKVLKYGLRSDLKIQAGPAFNIVLYNKRKTSQNIGWPYHVLADIKIIYTFSFK